MSSVQEDMIKTSSYGIAITGPCLKTVQKKVSYVTITVARYNLLYSTINAISVIMSLFTGMC